MIFVAAFHGLKAVSSNITSLMNKTSILARFEYFKPNKGGKLKIKKILFSDCYDFDEDVFINLMVHEMIHYYLALNGFKNPTKHGEEFMNIANSINEKYGLNITKKVDASSFKLTENAPKIVKKKSLFNFLFG
jgi:hypothetical protein